MKKSTKCQPSAEKHKNLFENFCVGNFLCKFVYPIKEFTRTRLEVDRAIQGLIGIWKCWFSGEGKTGVPGGNPLGAE